MKKLIVTCTAVAYAIAFIGCGDSTEPLPTDDGPAEDEVGDGDGSGDDEESSSGGAEPAEDE